MENEIMNVNIPCSKRGRKKR